MNLLVALFASQHVLKGFVNQLYSVAEPFLFKQFNVSGPQQQIYYGIVRTPWALKSIIGIVSDLFPILGYHKAPYMIIASVVGVICHTVVGFSTVDSLSVEWTVAALFGITMQFSVTDLMTEAKYSEKIQDHPYAGPDLITWVWTGINLGNVLALVLVSTVLALGGPRLAFILSIVPASLVLYPTVMNFLEEKKQAPTEVLEIRRLWWRQKEIIILAFLVASMALVLTITGVMFQSSYVNLLVSLSCLAILLSAFMLIVRPDIAKVNCFFIIQTSLAVGLRGATFFFYTDNAISFKAGPHFSTGFYTTVLGLASMGCSLMGLAIYNVHMRHWSYRRLLVVGNAVCSFLSLFDIILFTRFNLQLGIPDHVFVLGSTCQEVVRQWQWMPGIVVMSQLCPKGMEATMFALLAGSHNLGSIIAEYIGAFVLDMLHVRPSGAEHEGAKFDSLWKASLISTMLPMLTILLIPLLIPDAKQTDLLLISNRRSATVGSPLSRWLKLDSEGETPSDIFVAQRRHAEHA